MNALAESIRRVMCRPALRVLIGFAGLSLFLCGAVLSFTWSPSRLDEASSALPTNPPKSEVAGRAPLAFDQPKVVFELKLTGSIDQRRDLLARYLDEVEQRINGLGELDITFHRPTENAGRGGLSFHDPAAGSWIARTQLLTADLLRADDRVRLVFWMVEPSGSETSPESLSRSHFAPLWSEMEARMHLPLIDAAGELGGHVELIYPTEAEEGAP